MKASLILILFLTFISYDVYSQEDTTTNKVSGFHKFFRGAIIIRKGWTYSNDTVTKKGIQYRISNFAIQINAGATKYFNDSKTKKYFGNNWSSLAGVYFYYKNFFYGGSSYHETININDTLYFNGKKTLHNTSLEIDKTNILFGYNRNLKNNFSVAPYIGLLESSIFFNEDNSFIQSFGFTFGFSINKYINLKRYRYIIIFINNNFTYSNYSALDSNFGNYFYSIDFGVEYKVSFRKKIKRTNG